MVYIGMARYISHVRCINNALLAERQNPTYNAHGPFDSHRNALRVIMNLRLSTGEIAHMRNPNFRHHLLLNLVRKDARPSAQKSRVKPTNVCSNSFSAVRDLQTIRFGACEVYAGDFSILVPGTLRRSNSDFSARRMRVWRESATAVSYHVPCWQ